MESSEMNKNDPLKRNVEKGDMAEGLSPMDPPDAYSPPGTVEQVPYEELHPILQEFYDEHELIQNALVDFEEALISIQEKGVSKDINEKIKGFFEFFDSTFIPHDKREEKVLFPLLEARLIEKGEHSQGPAPTTAIDLMEEEHLKAIQLAGVIFNFFGLVFRLPDEKSRLIVLDVAIEQGKTLVELLRLHIFRENNVLFQLAHKYISISEFGQMKRKNEAQNV